jgi:hypothetical protein
MRLLFLTPFPPDPAAHHGGAAFLGTLSAAMARQAEVGIASLTAAPAALVPGVFAWQGQVTVPPRPPGRPLLHQARMLWRWRRLPLVAAKCAAPAMHALLRRAMAEFAPEVVLVEMAQMAQYLPGLADVPTVLTDHEAGCPANTHTGLGSLGDARDARLWGRYVQRFYPLATALQAVTTEDAATLSGLLHREVAVRPPVVAVPADPVRPAAAPRRALFLGDYAHGPNPEAARHLATRVLPLLRAALPDVELWLAGPNPAPIADLARLPGVHVADFVPDLHGLFSAARLLLAPLFSGAGFRVKCLSALAHGLPVVTNALGARGLDAPALARTVVEGDTALAEAALVLLRTPERAGEAGAAAHAWARRHVHPDAVARCELARLERLRLGRR